MFILSLSPVIWKKLHDFSERCDIPSFIGPKRFRPPALTVNDLSDDLDALFISHNHFDHLDYPSVKSLNKRYGERLTWLCSGGTRQWFPDNHVTNVVELDWWEEYHFSKKEVNIAFCPAQHWSRRTIFDMNKSLWGGYAIWDATQKFYFAGRYSIRWDTWALANEYFMEPPKKISQAVRINQLGSSSFIVIKH
ncbi:unnamed protein product, partial [Rotaria sp. Silwood1]